MSDEELVRSRDDEERIAALNRDVAALEQLWSDHFTVNAPTSEVVEGKGAVLETFINQGIIDFSSFERSIEWFRVDGDVAIVMGAERVQANTDAPQAGLRAGVTVHRRLEAGSRHVAAPRAARQRDTAPLS